MGDVEDRIWEMASRIVGLGDGSDKREFMAALVFAAAASIWHSYSDPEAGIEEFGARLPEALNAIRGGSNRLKQ